jgi:glycosyltransferase involved in cell wall biosynthesis
MALVSIIIPTYNRAKLLKEAVDSVLTQTYRDLEIIVVDDGSTDETSALMATYGERVRYIRQENAGVSAARNRGICASTGKYIGFLDDDDTYLATKIERQVEYLTKHPEIGFVHCRYYVMDEAGNYLHKIGLLPEGNVLPELLCRNFLWMSAPLISRACLEQVGGFDEHLSTAADYDLWLRIAQAGYTFGCIQQPLGAYRIQSLSMVTNIDRVEQEVIRILDRTFADPNLPAQAKAIQDDAYATWRFWFSRRYYAVGSWENAQRNLSAALNQSPHLMTSENIVEAFYSEAVDNRVENPMKYVEDVFTHLPLSASFMSKYRHAILCRVNLDLAFRQFTEATLHEGQQQLASVIRNYPDSTELTKAFAHLAVNKGMQVQGTPEAYTRWLFAHLPVEAAPLQYLRVQVTSDIHIGRAFEAYFNRNYRAAIAGILNAIRHRPTWLRNRGVMSVLGKSLLQWVHIQG